MSFVRCLKNYLTRGFFPLANQYGQKCHKSNHSLHALSFLFIMLAKFIYVIFHKFCEGNFMDG